MSDRTTDPFVRKASKMKDLQPYLVFAVVFAAWIALNRWVLPRFGVQT